jgi:hypothetical protein
MASSELAGTTDKSQPGAGPTAAASNSTAVRVEVLLAEFNSLKTEIQSRSDRQNSVIALNLTVIGAIAGLFYSRASDPKVFFVIPVLCPMLGMIYIDHVINIGHIGRFIQNVIKPQLAHTVSLKDLPDYEVYVRTLESRRVLRIFVLGIPILLMFAGVPLAALVLPFLVAKPPARDIIFAGPAVLGATFIAIFLFFWFSIVMQSSRVWNDPS